MDENHARLPEATELRKFVDALRAYMDLEPLYTTNNTASRDAVCLEALREGPVSVEEMALRVFGDATEKSRQRVSVIMRRLKGQGKTRMLRIGTWMAA